MKLWAIVPVKAFDSAKSRLGPALSSKARADFARSLFDHVAGQLANHERIAQVLIASNAPSVRAHAQERGFASIADPHESASLAEVIDSALAHAASSGASHGLVLMGDLPRLSQRSLSLLIDPLTDSGAVIAPDQHGVATNALGLRLPATTNTAFGSGKSLELHIARFRGAKLVRDPELEFDVDEPGDFAALPADAPSPD